MPYTPKYYFINNPKAIEVIDLNASKDTKDSDITLLQLSSKHACYYNLFAIDLRA